MDMVTLIQLFSVIIIYPWTRTRTHALYCWSVECVCVCVGGAEHGGWGSLHLKMKNNLAPDYKRHLPESNMNNQKSSLSPSDHITCTHTNIGHSHSNHILLSHRLFLYRIKLTMATIESKTFLPFLFWFKCFRKGLCRMDVCVHSSKHSSQTNGQRRWFVINMKCVRCGSI